MSGPKGKQGVAPTLAEKQEMALLKAAGHSHAEIARRVGRTRECVIAALRSKDVEGLKAQARTILLDGVAQFARDWREAAKVGAERGRHEPSRDALLHLGVVEPVGTGGPTVQLAVGFVPPGLPGLEVNVMPQGLPPAEDLGVARPSGSSGDRKRADHAARRAGDDSAVGSE